MSRYATLPPIFALVLAIAGCTAAAVPDRVELEVPVVAQERPAMCGPAVIEMLLRYWGEHRHDQYAVAAAILRFRPDQPRVVQSGILRSPQLRWDLYPGTGTRVMRDFLSALAPTQNDMLRQLPDDPIAAHAARDRLFAAVRAHLAGGVPVIVHQYWKGSGTRGHYRLVTGYDLLRREVYLNDPRRGRISQSVDEFLALWNVDEQWLHYNLIAFNVRGRGHRAPPLAVDLPAP